ncbi:MAG: T9SS type A sorting domain-containing protein [Flavobacterium lindanitolerans]|uniref:T9SS type A sorting domain-containing protein n=1 Tax=Flavobacterium lindanitolerans TaxID=428988 RepID=UPI001A54B96A|nr:T9SS type A sorting domain-containing protein [Flavobacterium lindanitolerans]MBL7868772.1 T9SS type A sorting domain-containing protein [Flavobacterium lindanitolerans]
MKKILLFVGLIVSSFNANAQLSCAAATPITANGTFTVSSITGTYGAGCWAPGTAPKSNWYSYTATANGEVTVSSDLAVNVGPTYSDDTRLSIFTGTCAALVCYDGNDDVSGTNYKSALTFPVQSGTTYYIAWDNRWSAKGFQFTFAFNAVPCVRPSLLTINDATNVTTNSASLSWSAALGNPSGYDVDYGAVGHTAGTGTIVNTTTTSVNLQSLPVSADLVYYLRSNCGGTQSAWVGPFNLYLAKTMPYSNNFDDTADPTDGFDLGEWSLSTSSANAAYANTAPGFAFSNTSATAATNSFMFFRPVSLSAGEQVTINFQTRFLGGATDIASLNVTVGNAPLAASQTTVVQAFPSIAGGSTTYTARTATWTAPAAGIYYFALNNVSGTTADTYSLIVDTITASSVLSTNEFSASNLSVYPNPSNGILNISSDSNILLNNLSITDLNGRTVKTAKLNGDSSAQINIADLAAGVYMMTINSDQGSVTKKIIKN